MTMAPRHSLSCSLNVTFHYWGRPLMESLDRAAAAGFRTIELLDPFAVDLDDLARALDRRGLSVDVFNLPMGDFYAGERGFAGDPGRRTEFVAGVEHAARIAERLGTRKINAHSGCRVEGESRSTQMACLVERLAWAAEHLDGGGVRVNTELLNPLETPGYLLSSLEAVCSTIAALEGRVGLQLDIYHLQRTHGDLIGTIRTTAGITGHYQVADTPHRTEPGSGEIDFAGVLDEIAATGYRGFVGCEYQPSSPTVDAFAWMADLGAHKG